MLIYVNDTISVEILINYAKKRNLIRNMRSYYIPLGKGIMRLSHMRYIEGIAMGYNASVNTVGAIQVR